MAFTDSSLYSWNDVNWSCVLMFQSSEPSSQSDAVEKNSILSTVCSPIHADTWCDLLTSKKNVPCPPQEQTNNAGFLWNCWAFKEVEHIFQWHHPVHYCGLLTLTDQHFKADLVLLYYCFDALTPCQAPWIKNLW